MKQCNCYFSVLKGNVSTDSLKKVGGGKVEKEMPIPVKALFAKFLRVNFTKLQILVNRICNGNSERLLPNVALLDAAVMLL